jgi:hypothetical protein
MMMEDEDRDSFDNVVFDRSLNSVTVMLVYHKNISTQLASDQGRKVTHSTQMTSPNKLPSPSLNLQ